jgi:hypothetical protein
MTGEAALAALSQLLQAYDLANRIEIDSLYAQFSPTLDDFYAETLRIDFPDVCGAPGAVSEEVRPDLTLTRTIAGLEPKSVRSTGAAFPLARAAALVWQALAESSTVTAGDLATALASGAAWLCPAQLGRSQVVELLLEPGGREAMALLRSLQG